MRQIIFLIIFIFSITTIFAQEPDSTFEFWVSERPYFPGSLSYLRVNQDGDIVDQFSALDFDIRGATWGRHAFSVSGRFYATVFDIAWKQGEPDKIVVLDTVDDSIIMDREFHTSSDAVLQWIDDEHLLHSVIYFDDSWEIQVISVPDGTIVHSLKSSDLVQFGFDPTQYQPRYSISFLAVSSEFVHFRLRGSTFKWDWNANTLSASDLFVNSGYGKAYYSYLPTEHLLAFPHMDDRLLFYMRLDERYEQYPYGFYYGNSVHILDLQTGQRIPIFTSTTDTIQEAHWIQNGERLLVGLSDGTRGRLSWSVIERDGILVAELFSGHDISNITPTVDGFLFNSEVLFRILNVTPEDETEPRDTIYFFNTRTMTYRNYLEIRHESSDDGIPPQSPEIVWTSLDSTASLDPLTPLMPALPDETPSQTLTLRKNGAAYVSIQNGESLNLRESTSTNAPIVARLQNNQRVILIDDPEEAEGFTWWPIWVDRKTRGWVVEAVDDEIMLLPPDITRDAPLTLEEANLIQGNTGVAPLSVGIRVRVVSDTAMIRAETGLQSQALDVLLRNGQSTVIGGPFNDDGLVWWKVEADTGTIGWMAEVTETGVIQLAPVG